jgi:AcrR family transcriptional regulator
MSRVTSQKRHTAAERREAILQVAITEFAVGGLQGASTDEIARRAGISQPYLFRLYGTKMELFLAVIERVFAQTLEVFQLAAGRAATGEADLFSVLGRAYGELVTSDRRLLLATLQSFAACKHTEVQEAVWRGFDEVYSYVQAVTRASPEEMHRFIANGLVILVGAAIDMPASDRPWARGLLEACSHAQAARLSSVDQ